MIIKDIAKKICYYLKIDITKNQKYDRLTNKIIDKFVKPKHNCIDIGCHKGEILQYFLKKAPLGHPIGFEPIPYLYTELEQKFKGVATIYPYALSDHSGKTEFHLVKKNPAYSGIKERIYDFRNPQIEIIDVTLATLDSLIASDFQVDFIKIDVEGGEFDVLKGAVETIKRSNPIILFEYGKGSAFYYGTQPGELFDFFENTLGYHLYTLKSFYENGTSIPKNRFEQLFSDCEEYYFVASKS